MELYFKYKKNFYEKYESIERHIYGSEFEDIFLIKLEG
jgi:hypothetical protein